MHRQQLLDLLQQYCPVDLQEKKFKEKLLAFVQEFPNCFERSLEVGHITASCWLVNKDNSKALLMHHTKLDKWFQLGGHCDGDSNVLQVALKEAQEESGIETISPVSKALFDIDIHLIPANKREKEHYHYDVRFLLQATSDQQLTQNRESKELRWISKDKKDLPTDSPSVMRMFDKWASNKF